MKQYLAWILILVSLLSLGCDANATNITETTQESEAEPVPILPETPEVIRKPEPPRQPIEPVPPLPPVLEKNPPPLNPEIPIRGNESLISVWSDVSMDAKGHPFIFNLPFDTVQVSAETGYLQLRDGTGGSMVTLTKDDMEGVPPAIYWKSDNNKYSDILHVELYDSATNASYTGQISIQRTHRPFEGMDVYMAHLQYSKMIIYPSPLGQGTVLSTEGFSKIIYQGMAKLKASERDEITDLPWIELVKANQTIEGATIDVVPPKARATYRLSFPTSDATLGNLVIYYDSLEDQILGYGLRD